MTHLVHQVVLHGTLGTSSCFTRQTWYIKLFYMTHLVHQVVLHDTLGTSSVCHVKQLDVPFADEFCLDEICK
jgi:hypothetical protein